VIDARMSRERRAGFLAIPCDDVQRAFRQAGFGGEFGYAQYR
jgi:hypothetical protein